jgi:hypothetical protein
MVQLDKVVIVSPYFSMEEKSKRNCPNFTILHLMKLPGERSVTIGNRSELEHRAEEGSRAARIYPRVGSMSGHMRFG